MDCVILTPKALKYFCKTMKTKSFFQSEIIINILVTVLLHLNTHFMGLRPLYILFFNAGTDYRRQKLTSVDVRFWRL